MCVQHESSCDMLMVLCVFEQLLALGFQQDMADAALRIMGDDLAQATQMLLDNQGVVPPELLSPSPPSSSSEEPSTSSDSTGETRIQTHTNSPFSVYK